VGLTCPFIVKAKFEQEWLSSLFFRDKLWQQPLQVLLYVLFKHMHPLVLLTLTFICLDTYNVGFGAKKHGAIFG